MRTTKQIAVIGTGAVGGYYGGLLQRAGFGLHFLLHSDYGHVCRHGLAVDSPNGSFRLPDVKAYNDPRKMPRCDLVVVALKTERRRFVDGNHHRLADKAAFEEMVHNIAGDGFQPVVAGQNMVLPPQLLFEFGFPVGIQLRRLAHCPGGFEGCRDLLVQLHAVGHHHKRPVTRRLAQHLLRNKTIGATSIKMRFICRFAFGRLECGHAKNSDYRGRHYGVDGGIRTETARGGLHGFRSIRPGRWRNPHPS